jgi:hydroxymethylpyrimidine pyrophosphatase-like HAD family hydrolase
LALDLDGTVLDSDGVLRPVTAEAILRAAKAGVRPVLCTGRRYRRALPVAEALGLDSPLVCNSGALVKNPKDHRTLARADLDQEVVQSLLGLLRSWGEPALSFTDLPPDQPDFLVGSSETGRCFFDEYVALNRTHAAIDPDWEARGSIVHFHVCAVGTRPAMLAVESKLHDALPSRIRTFVQKSPRYAGTMCEVIHAEASKWSAVLRLAAEWGVDASEICAVGDDMNDLPMIAGAGLGVAMAHAPTAVRSAASFVTADQDGDGVARFIHDVLLR